jgi:putative flippase GtrA
VVLGSSSPAPTENRWWRKVSTYTAGSLVAAGCSELALIVCYAVLHLPAAASAVIAWLCGAVPNYWLNRTWTWRRTGRPHPRRELLPYAVIVLGTLALAAVVTRAVDAALSDSTAATRTTMVAAAFLGVYVVMFLLRYLLLDRLFGRLDTLDSEPTEAEAR